MIIFSPELTDEEKRIRSFRFYDRWYAEYFKELHIFYFTCTFTNRAGNGAIYREEMLHTLVVLGDVPPEAARDGAAMPDDIENLFRYTQPVVEH